jgi:dihydrodipicolinate synthase/N-acetylneuraminate lyase
VTDPIVVVALTTPFGDDGRPAVGVFREHVAFLAERGVDAVMPAGTTGEGPLLEDHEVVELVAAAVAERRGGLRVVAHVGRPGTEATLRLARRALDAGADGLTAVVPYYYPLEDDQILAHYRALREALGDAPIFAYTIPARTGNELSVAAASKLPDEGLTGLKDSTKSLDRHRGYLDAVRGRGFGVLMGSDGLVLDALRAGATGCVSAVANARPDLAVNLVRAFVRGDAAAADRLQSEVAAAREQLSQGPALAGIKRSTSLALRPHGIKYPDRLRPPLG